MPSLQSEIQPSVDDGEWRHLLARCPQSTPFHEPWFCRSVAEHHPQWKARWIEVRRDGVLCAGMPYHLRSAWGLRDQVSGWAGSYGGPLVAVDAEESVAKLLAEKFLASGGARRRRIEVVWAAQDPPPGPWTGWVGLDTSVLELDGHAEFEDFLMEAFPKNRRNECTRSVKRGLRVERDESGSSLRAVWEIYVDQCRHWNSPAVDLEVWRDVLQGSEASHLFVATLDGDQVVGGHLCVELGDELFAWLGTTRRMDRVFPSSLLIREESRWAHGRRLRRLNLGSSMGLGGVQNYKQLLGARVQQRWILRQQAWWWPRGGS